MSRPAEVEVRTLHCQRLRCRHAWKVTGRGKGLAWESDREAATRCPRCGGQSSETPNPYPMVIMVPRGQR